MICPPLPPWSLIEDWMARHRHPTSFVLHMFGIPPTILGILLIPIYLTLASIPIFLLALALFVGGYLIQFTGHLFDGTEPGEIAYLRRKLGWSYAKIAPVPPRRVAPGAGLRRPSTGEVSALAPRLAFGFHPHPLSRRLRVVSISNSDGWVANSR